MEDTPSQQVSNPPPPKKITLGTLAELCPLGRPLLQVVRGSKHPKTASLTRPIQVFAIEYGLCESLARRGIRPAAVLGHSFGEFAAAVAAGVMSLKDAARLVSLRASLASAMDPTGAMYLIHAPSDTVQRAIESLSLDKDKYGTNGAPVTIAASNGPRMTNIAGTEEACAAVCASIKAPKVKLDVPHAYHSPLMQPLLTGMRAALEQISLHSPSSSSSHPIQFFPTVSGYIESADEATPTLPQYWLDQCVRGVEFMPAMHRLADMGYDTFVEIGPRPTLTKMGQRCVTSAQKLGSDWLATLSDDAGENETSLRHLEIVTKGLEAKRKSAQVDEARGPSSSAEQGLRKAVLNRKRFWRPMPHRLVKEVTRRDDELCYFDRTLGVHLRKLLQQHRVNDIAVIPGSLYLDAAVALFLASNLKERETLTTQTPIAGVRLRDIIYERPLQLPTTDDMVGLASKNGIAIRGSLARNGSVHICSRVAKTGVETPHFSCSVDGKTPKSAKAVDVPFLTRELPSMDSHAVYEASTAFGVHYGPQFRRIQKLWRGKGLAVAALLPSKEESGFLLDVGLLDSAFQTCGFAVDRHEAYMPFSVASISVYGRPELAATTSCSPSYYSIAKLVSESQGMVEMNLTVVDGSGKVLVEVESLKSRAAPRQDAAFKHCAYEIEWAEIPSATQSTATTPDSSAVLLIGSPGQAHEMEPLLMQALEQRMGCTVSSIGSQRRLEKAVLASANLAVLLPSQSLPKGDVNLASVAEAVVEHGLNVIQSFLRVLTESDTVDLPTLCVLTNGAISTGPDTDSVNPSQATLWGLARTARVEYPDLGLVMIDLEIPAENSTSATSTLEALQTILTAHRSSWNHGETEFAVRDGRILVPRMVESFAEECRLPQQLSWRQASQSSDLSKLKWVSQPDTSPEIAPDAVLLNVRAVGLNFKDVLTAAGVDVGAVNLGADCAGTIVAVGSGVTGLSVGDRVFGIVPGCFKHLVQARADRLARIPSDLSYHEAATLPSAYLTAHLAVYEHGKPKITSGSRVLVHAGTGAVGQAVIRLARNLGCEVYATAGCEEKRAYLKEKLGAVVALSSRDAVSFAREIKEYLDGGSIDLVVNSLAGDYIRESMSCLRDGGCFAELGRKSIWTREEARQHRPDVSYHIVELDKLHQQPGGVSQLLRDLAAQLESSQIGPLPSEVFSCDKTTEAFTRMRRARHIGKVVLSLQKRPETRSTHDVLRPGLVQPAAIERTMENISATALKNLNVPLAELERGWRQLCQYCFNSLYSAAQKVSLEQVTPQQRRLYNRYKAGDPTAWFTVGDSSANSMSLDHIAKTYPFLQPQVAMLQQVDGEHERVFRGETDPLTKLFSGRNSKQIAQDLYEHGVYARFCNEVAAEITRYFVQSRNPGETLRMLEVGAGTGGTTSKILPSLGDAVSSYRFTDLSTSFLRHAERRFAADYPFVDYQLFDVEKDPVLCGIRSNSFDVVLACNVLHATKNLMRTMTHVRKILKYGGYLVLSEVTFPSPFADATFGMTTGWWLFEDLDLRPDYPLLTSAQWRSFLTEKVGFDKVWISNQQGPLRSQSVIVARARSPASMAIPRPLEPPSPVQPARHGSVVLSGGLGGLGIVTARLLLERGWRRFAFLSRTGKVSSGGANEWETFENAAQASAAKFKIWATDVADSQSLSKALSEVRTQLGPIMGVVQAAGILDSKTLINQDMARFRNLMAPKVSGSWNLHQETIEDPIQFFALFSSMASVLGSAGQANHATANAFMDSLAAHRRLRGLPAISIQFSSVSGVGEAARKGADLRHAIGYAPIPKALAKNGIESLMDSDMVNVAFSPIVWPKMLAKYRVPPRLFEVFAGQRSSAAPQPGPPEPSPPSNKKSKRGASKMPKAVRQKHMVSAEGPKPVPLNSASSEAEAEQIVGSAFSAALGYDIPRSDMGWQEAGIDSLLAIELRNGVSARLIEKGIKKDVPQTIIFDYPTPRQCVAFIARMLGSAVSVSDGHPTKPSKKQPQRPRGRKNKSASRSKNESEPRPRQSAKPGSHSLAETPQGSPDVDFLELVLAAWAETMSTPIQPGQTFTDCGLDSLSSVELQFALQTRFNDILDELPENLVLQHPSPRAVADWLQSQYRSASGALHPKLLAEQRTSQPPTPDDYLSTVLDAWNTTVGGTIGPDDDFMSSGLDSLSSVELHFALQQAVGDELEIPENIFFLERSPAAISAWLAKRKGSEDHTQSAEPSIESDLTENEDMNHDSEQRNTDLSDSALSDVPSEEDNGSESGSSYKQARSDDSNSDTDGEEEISEEESESDPDSPGLRLDDATAIVNSAIQDVLGYTVDSRAPLAQSGVDSLSSLEIQNSLQAKAPRGVKIPATVVFDYPTVEKIAQFLVASVQPKRQPSKGLKPERKPKPAVAAKVASRLTGSRKARGDQDARRVVPLQGKAHQDRKSSLDDPIVIVGMASRFPGQKDDSVESWFNWLLESKDAFVEVPPSRFDIDAVYDSSGQGVSQPGTSYVRHAAFIDGAELFDHTFFGMSEAEAARIDPQQRLVLETSFQALYSAGYTKHKLDGRDVGVYVGCCSFDWSKMPEARGSAYSGTGAAGSILANRVSYALNLCAPSLTIDTACSSALVALDTAASALRQNKCSAAVVTAGMCKLGKNTQSRRLMMASVIC